MDQVILDIVVGDTVVSSYLLFYLYNTFHRRMCLGKTEHPKIKLAIIIWNVNFLQRTPESLSSVLYKVIKLCYFLFQLLGILRQQVIFDRRYNEAGSHDINILSQTCSCHFLYEFLPFPFSEPPLCFWLG